MTDVASDRDITVIFKPFSLAIKNDVLVNNDDSPYAPQARLTHQVLRVMESVRKEYGDEMVGTLYAQVGKKIHIDEDETIDWLPEVLESLKIDAAHLDAREDVSYDAVIETSMQEAFDVCGTDIGTPVIRVETSEGPRGFFGPVISELPEHEEGLALWDGISAMISFPNFFELKRTREVGPDTASTARLFS